MSETPSSEAASSAKPPLGGAIRLLLASSNPGKLAEIRALASDAACSGRIELDLLPRFSELPPFSESAPTFAENAAGKALHYSRFTDLPVIADDSGLVVPGLGGAPGVQSARYAGPGASDADRIAKLLYELRAHRVLHREAQFVCVIALAQRGRVLAVISDSVEGEILSRPRGTNGFGYDPVFFFDPLDKTFGEISAEEKNRYSHRGKAFRKLLEFLPAAGLA